MRFAFLMLSPLIFLAGCPDETIIVDPPVPQAKAPKLASGEYGVLVVGVTRAECEGLREQDLWGMKLPMSLRVSGQHNEANLAGFSLAGEFSRGELVLESTEDTVVVYTEEDEPVEVSTTDEEQEDQAGQDRKNCAATEDAEESEGSGSSTGNGGDVDHGAPPDEMFMALDLQVSSTRDASGVMTYEARGCSIEAQVVVRGFESDGGEEPKPVPVEEEESGCDDEASDCG